MSKFTKVHASSLLSLLNDGYHLKLTTPGLFLARDDTALQLLVDDSFDRTSPIPAFADIPSFSSIRAIGGCLQGKEVLIAGFTRDFAKVRVKDDENEKLRRIKTRFLGFQMTRPRRSPRIAARSSPATSDAASFKLGRITSVSKYMPRAPPRKRPKSRRMSVTRIRQILANVRQQKKELHAKREALRPTRIQTFPRNQVSFSAPSAPSAPAPAPASARAEDLPPANVPDDSCDDFGSADISFNEKEEISEFAVASHNRPLEKSQERSEVAASTSAISARKDTLNVANAPPVASRHGPIS
ncbi:hypothetical protein ACHAXS_001220, partial [Conticribra weissflogii]